MARSGTAFDEASADGSTELFDDEWPPVTVSEHDGVRYLHLGSVWVQGAMRIRKPQVVELDYVQRMLATLLWRAPEAWGRGRAVQLGLGAAALTRFTAQQLRMATTAVELNPQVIAACAQYFHLPREAELVRGDAAAWLALADPASVALLQVDLYDHEAAAPVLDSPGFYAACRAVLDEDGGLMAVNLFGRDSRYAQSLAHIVQAFGADQVWGLRPTREGNTVVVAGRGAVLPAREELLRRAAMVQTRFGTLGLAGRRWPRLLRPVQPANERLP